MLHGVIYLGERAVSVETHVSESETLCVLQAEEVCFKKNLLENLLLDILVEENFLRFKIESQ